MLAPLVPYGVFTCSVGVRCCVGRHTRGLGLLKLSTYTPYPPTFCTIRYTIHAHITCNSELGDPGMPLKGGCVGGSGLGLGMGPGMGKRGQNASKTRPGQAYVFYLPMRMFAHVGGWVHTGIQVQGGGLPLA